MKASFHTISCFNHSQIFGLMDMLGNFQFQYLVTQQVKQGLGLYGTGMQFCIVGFPHS